MVTSVFVGTIALAGSAAAVSNQASVGNANFDTGGNVADPTDNAPALTISNLTAGAVYNDNQGENLRLSNVTIDFTDTNFDGSFENVEDGDIVF